MFVCLGGLWPICRATDEALCPVYDPVAYLSGAATEVESSVYRPRSMGSALIRRTYEIYENERWIVVAGWSSSVRIMSLLFMRLVFILLCLQHLFPTDPDRYCDTSDKGYPVSR